MSRRREVLSLGALLLTSWALAMLMRVDWLSLAVVGSDSLGSYLAAWSALNGTLPKPPNPEGGHSLWLSVLPLVAVADSLEQLFFLRFLQGALVAPLAAASAWVLARPWGRAEAMSAGWVAGALVAVDAGLVDTLVSAFRGYGGPEWVGLATLALALGVRGHRWAWGLGVAALVAAAGQHPLAFGVSLGALAVLPLVWRRAGARPVLAAVLLGAVLSLPRLWWLSWLADCDQGGVVACLGQVAGGSSEQLGVGEIFARIWQDRVGVDLGGLALVLGLGGVLAVLPGDRRAPLELVLFSLVGLVGIVLLGLSISTLRPYHLRHVAVPMAVLAGLGAGRFGRRGLFVLLAVLWFGRSTWHVSSLDVVNRPGQYHQLHAHDLLAVGLPKGPIRLDAVIGERPPKTEVAGVVLAAVLAGRDPAELHLGPDALVVLLLAGDPAHEALPLGDWAPRPSKYAGNTLLPFPDLSTAEAAVCPHLAPGARIGGAYDWMVALHPEDARLEDARWSCDSR